jgi:hypothetical protein
MTRGRASHEQPARIGPPARSCAIAWMRSCSTSAIASLGTELELRRILRRDRDGALVAKVGPVAESRQQSPLARPVVPAEPDRAPRTFDIDDLATLGDLDFPGAATPKRSCHRVTPLVLAPGADRVETLGELT